MTYDSKRPRQEAERRGRETEREGSRRETRFDLLRAVYPLNPGIPHFLDFPEDR